MARNTASGRIAATNRIRTTTRNRLRDMTGEALTLNGVSGNATIPDANQLDLVTSYSFCFWGLMLSLGESNAGRVFDKGGATAYSCVIGTGGTGILRITHAGTTVNSANSLIRLNQWTHYGYVYNDTANTIQFYINGVATGSPVTQNVNPGINTTVFRIGNIPNLDTGTFHGKILEPILFNDTITAGEMLIISQQGAEALSESTIAKIVLLGAGSSAVPGTYFDLSQYGNAGTVTTATFTQDWPIRSRTAIT